MFGVVLWADENDSKAVIWCEDQGDLAYYSQHDGDHHDHVALDAGDLIQFDLCEERNCRMARHLCRVETCHAPSLPGDLRRQRQCNTVARRCRAAKVVSLQEYREPMEA